ncbi:hypothetical protein HK097_008816 [Rhizophlyctis rosea]|uniref:Uncharacterized protein n=1 Tax=Rhizophlyctis rosea TaxID=64517 RepID=A0AAD5S9U2_9FUNG|nr:hypothetical protein HK097_008816 [Rhizophlyctis rosea]
MVGAQGWTDSLARKILDGVVTLIQEGGDKMGPAMIDALEKAEEAANALFEFSKEHPEVGIGLLTIIAVGILVVMMAPWVIEALGFAELGPMEEALYGLGKLLEHLQGILGIKDVA